MGQKHSASDSMFCGLPGILFIICVLSGSASKVWASDLQGNEISLQGVLRAELGEKAALRVQEKEIVLVSDRENIGETLVDVRLSGKLLKVIGRYLPDGTFEVHEFFTVRKDGLYRVIYFCFT